MEDINSRGFSDRFRCRDTVRTITGSETVRGVRDLELETDMIMTETDFGTEEEACRRAARYISWKELGSHPYIAFCFFVKPQGSKLYVYSEECPGRTAGIAVKDESLYSGGFSASLNRITEIALKTMIGLGYAHRRGVLHTALCPQNIIIGEDGIIKLTGLADAKDMPPQGCAADYASPEQRALTEGTAPEMLTPASDIYSWALTVAEMLRGSCLSDPDLPAEEYLKDLRIHNGMLTELLAGCLNKDPEDRPDAAEIIGKLDAIRRILMAPSDSMLRSMTEFADKFTETPDSMCNRALCCVAEGSDGDARKLWERIMSVYHRHDPTIYNYNVFLWERGEIGNEELYTALNSTNPAYRSIFLSEYDRVAEYRPLCRVFYTLSENTDPDDIRIRFSTDSKELLIYSPEENRCIIMNIRNCLRTGTFPPEEMQNGKWAEPVTRDDPETDEIYAVTVYSPDGSLRAMFRRDTSTVFVGEVPEHRVFERLMCPLEYYTETLFPDEEYPDSGDNDDEPDPYCDDDEDDDEPYCDDDEDDDEPYFDDDEDYEDEYYDEYAEEEEEESMNTPLTISAVTETINRLRSSLLEKVKGQDHAVNAFCEGIWNSMVLGSSDSGRERPAAVFLFAGPPGVGKTFLAMTAGELLGRPFKSFNMGNYSDEQAHKMLTGYAKTFVNPFPGQLTDQVKNNPDSILLFDEIEKANANVHKLFLSILDLGTIKDNYHNENVSFGSTIIIFTTNLGRSLYEGKQKMNCSKIPVKMLLEALKREKDPRSGQPYFPPELVSRFGMGYPTVFNNLSPHMLIKIAEDNFNSIAGAFEEKYGLTVTADRDVLISLMFREGGRLDARDLSTNVVKFFKTAVMDLFTMMKEDIEGYNRFEFVVRRDDMQDDIARLFRNDLTPKVLVYASGDCIGILKSGLPEIAFHAASDIDEALDILGREDISLVLVDVGDLDLNADGSEAGSGATYYAAPSAKRYRKGTDIINTVTERLPEMPVYLLEDSIKYSETMMQSYIRAGVRDKISMEEAENDLTALGDRFRAIMAENYMLDTAEKLSASNKVISFETGPTPYPAEKKIVVDLRNFRIKSADFSPEDLEADSSGKFRANVLSEAEKPSERFGDIIGSDKAVDELRTVVNYLNDPVRYRAKGFTAPKGVLLYGPPGTGKTMLARATAGESSVSFLPCNASEFVGQYTGSGPAAIRSLFERARRNAPAIIFIDEVNAIAKKRTGTEYNHSEESTLEALFTEMDGFATHAKTPVVVIAATNFGIKEGDGGVATLDSGFVRRFSKKLRVGLPDKDGRIALLTAFLSKVPTHTVAPDIIDNIAERAVDQSPANLRTLVDNAMNDAAKLNKVLNDDILMNAFEVMLYGEENKRPDEESLRHTAIHESGHTVNYLESGFVPSYLTIESRENFGGYMMHASDDIEGTRKTRADYLAQIRTCLGGRAAEIVYYGKDGGLTTGASGDLRSATAIANAILTVYGMDDEFGLCTIAPPEDIVRKRINEMLDREMENAINTVEANRLLVDNLTTALLEMKRLTTEQIRIIKMQDKKLTRQDVKTLMKK